MSKALLLVKAARVLKWYGSKPKWPDALTLKELATLESMDSNSHIDETKKLDCFTLMRWAEESGSLAVRGIRTQKVLVQNHGLPVSYSDFGMIMRAALDIEEKNKTVNTVFREDYAAWKDRPNPPSEYIAAWLETTGLCAVITDKYSNSIISDEESCENFTGTENPLPKTLPNELFRKRQSETAKNPRPEAQHEYRENVKKRWEEYQKNPELYPSKTGADGFVPCMEEEFKVSRTSLLEWIREWEGKPKKEKKKPEEQRKKAPN